MKNLILGMLLILTVSSCLKDKDGCDVRMICIKNLTGGDRYVVVNYEGYEIKDSVGHCWELYDDTEKVTVEWSKKLGQTITAEVYIKDCITEYTVY